MSVLRPSFKNTGPFDNRTQIYHLDTGLVGYSDSYCIQKATAVISDYLITL